MEMNKNNDNSKFEELLHQLKKVKVGVAECKRSKGKNFNVMLMDEIERATIFEFTNILMLGSNYRPHDNDFHVHVNWKRTGGKKEVIVVEISDVSSAEKVSIAYHTYTNILLIKAKNKYHVGLINKYLLGRNLEMIR